MISRIMRFLGHFMPTQEGEITVSQSDGKARIYRGAAVRVLEDQGNKGVAGGYPSLDGSALVPTSQLGTGTANSTTFLRGDGTWAAGGGGGAPTNAQYLTLTSDATLTQERTLSLSAPLSGSDGGAGSAYTLSLSGWSGTTDGDMLYRNGTAVGSKTAAQARTWLDAEQKVKITDGAAVTRTVATLRDGEFLKVSGSTIISAAVNVAAFIALTDGFDQHPDENAYLTPAGIFMSDGSDA